MNDYYYEKEKAQITEAGIESFVVKAVGKKNVSVPHLHSSIEILLCTAGSLLVNLDGKDFHIRKGEMILLRSNIIHSIYSTDFGYSEYYVLKVKLSLIFGFASKKNQLLYMLTLTSKNKAAKTVWHEDECKEAFASVENILKEQSESEYGCDIAVTINAVTVLLKIMRDTKNDICLLNAKDDLIKRIYDATIYINNHYMDDISAKAICKDISLSYNYFSNVFKNITGLTFKDYLIKTRISHAEQDLLSTDKSITDIAIDCGFNNTSYFISTFKKLKKITPSKLRKMHGEDSEVDSMTS